ncbi:MAG TPA: solute carrier family 23 protein, partial [Leptolyngbya sp.]|nr:solute carrier family 23 protein [Leptolyngbya sp.]
MSHTEVQHTSDTVSATRSKLIYGLNDKPPLLNTLFIAIQHVSVIFVPSVAPLILIGKALKLDPASTSYLVGMTLFAAGIATFIQAKRIGPFGSGLLSIQGPSYAFLAPIFVIIDEGNKAGHPPEQTLSLILGLCFFGSFIPIILSRFIHLMQKVFTPLVTGTVVTLIGLTLIKIGLYQMAGGDEAKAAGNFGSLEYWGPSSLVFAIVVLCGATGNRYLRMGS